MTSANDNGSNDPVAKLAQAAGERSLEELKARLRSVGEVVQGPGDEAQVIVDRHLGPAVFDPELPLWARIKIRNNIAEDIRALVKKVKNG